MTLQHNTQLIHNIDEIQIRKERDKVEISLEGENGHIEITAFNDDSINLEVVE